MIRSRNRSRGGVGGVASPPSFTPTDISGLQMWLDASDAATITQSSGAVSQWNDKSGNLYHATQGTGANQPLTGVGSVNGKNAIRFDGVNDTMISTLHNSGISNGDVTILSVFKYTSATTRSWLLRLRGTTNYGVSLDDSATGNDVFATNSSSVIKTPKYSDTNPHIIVAGRGGSSGYILHDNGVQGVGVASNTAVTNTYIGSYGGTSDFLKADLCEMIVYNKNLSLSEVNTVGNYLSSKWGVTWTEVNLISSSGILALPNPYSGVGASIVHPDLLYIPSGFAGYNYWIAYTPYPNLNSDYENPCVACSNDLNTWVALSTNPIVAKPAGGYNSDTNLALSEDGSTLYMTYRERTTNNTIYVLETTDGVTWSAPVATMVTTVGVSDTASQSLFYDTNVGLWRMYWHDIVDLAGQYPVYTATSSSPYGAWSTPQLCNVTVDSGRVRWHGECRLKNDGTYYYLSSEPLTSNIGLGNLRLSTSTDGINFTSQYIFTGGYYKSSILIDQSLILISSLGGRPTLYEFSI